MRIIVNDQDAARNALLPLVVTRTALWCAMNGSSDIRNILESERMMFVGAYSICYMMIVTPLILAVVS
jgi:hypothetical protein